jgi:hypothetical protein
MCPPGSSYGVLAIELSDLHWSVPSRVVMHYPHVDMVLPLCCALQSVYRLQNCGMTALRYQINLVAVF